MAIVDLVFGTVFGFILRVCYSITDNFGWAIVVFSIFTKTVLFPISLISQKNSIKLVKMQPKLAELQAYYESDPAMLIKEQKALYKKEEYSAVKAMLPLIVQIPLIIGVVSVVYNPSRHIGDVFNSVFFGLDLLSVPENLFVPAIAIVSTILLSIIQSKYNVISGEQSFIGKLGITITLVAFTAWFALTVASGAALFWISSNLLGIAVLAVCNRIIDPKKYIDYENRSIKPKVTKADKNAKRERKKTETNREKEDMKRFFSQKKELVFFSESSGYYKYFQRYIDYILENSDITVHYLTADFDDQVFNMSRPRFETYFCSPNGLITTFMKMDAEIVVMTMPDFHVYHYKRSLVKKDIEYIYTDHCISSFHLTYRNGAFDHYDTVFCYCTNHNEEIRAIEQKYNLPKKKLINVGFGLLDTLIECYNNDTISQPSKKPQILIAPSWQKDNILDSCLEPLLKGLLAMEARIIIRPHPEYVKRFTGKMNEILRKYRDKIGPDFEIQTDFSSNSAIYNSDILITDWSNTAQEFSFATKKPSLFINTPMKIMNPEWQEIAIEPLNIWIRSRIGVELDADKLYGIRETVDHLLDCGDAFKSEIEDLMTNLMYNIGHTAKAGGGYIVEQIERRRENTIE